MSGNRDELPEQTGGDTQGSSRSRQQESQEAVAERLGIDPEQVATRDTLDRGVQQRLTDEGQQAAERSAAQRVAEQAGFIERDDVSADVDPETFAVDRQLTEEGTNQAEQRLAEQTAADREFVRPSDLQANVDPETFSAEASLTEQGRQNAQQRQAEQLRQQAANQSDRFGADDFAVDRSGEEISVEPTESAVDRERNEQIEQLRQEAAQQSDRFGADDFAVDRSGDQISVEATEEAINREQREQAAQQIDQQITGVDIDSGDIRSDGDGFIPRDSVLRAAAAEQTGDFRQTRVPFNEVASTIDSNGGDIADLTQLRDDVSGGKIKIADVGPVARGIDGFSITDLERLANQGETETISTDPSDFRVSATGDNSREVEFTEQAVQARAAAGFDTQLSGIDVGVDDVEPVDSGGFGLDDGTQQQLSDQQRQEFADALESGDAFESGEAPDALGDIDPQTDISIEDGSLTLADETQAELVEAQIRAQAGETPGFAFDSGQALEGIGNRLEIRKAFREQILAEAPPAIESVVVEGQEDGTLTAERVRVNSRRYDGEFRDVEDVRMDTDLLDGVPTEIDATEEFDDEFSRGVAARASSPVVDVDPELVDISGGQVDIATPESLTIESGEIGSDGLTAEGQADFARRQLQSIQTTEGVSVDTPVNSQPFANVSAALSQAADGQGSLSSATRIVAAGGVNNIGELDDTPDAQIINSLDPEQAGDIFERIDEQQVREAQQDIQQRRQQLESDPGAVLESIASNQDEFVNDSTRIGVAGERGRRIRQSARAQLSELEADIAAGDDGVSPGDVNLTLTDDLSGIRSVNQAGRQAIAQSVDDQLSNFGAQEIDVNVSDGEINTSIEDSVRERFIENAQRVEEIQVRNEIADETEGIGRRDIEVDAGEGVSPSDELITETLGTDVNGNIESFDQLQQAAETQARFEARQQALEQVNSQTIGSVYPGNVTVERTEQGFEANVSGAAAESVDLSAVNAGQATTIQTTNQTDTNVSLGNLSNVTGAVGLNTPEQIDTGSGEQFGDAVPDFIEDPARGFQQGVSQIGAQLGGGVGNAVEQVGEFTAPIEQGENFVGQTPAESTGNLAEGAIEGTANLIGSAPVVGVEATEFGIFAAQNPGETASQLPDAISERALLAGEQATSSPAEFTGQVVGSGAGSGALFRATQGTRLGTVSRATLQPGEELVKTSVRRGALGERAVDVTPGVTRGQIDRDFGSERGQTSPLLGAERLLDDSGDGDTTIEIEDTGPRAAVENDPRTGLDDIEQAAARGRQRSVDIDQDLDTSVRSVTRNQDIQSISQDAEIRSPSRSVGGGSDSRPISEIDPDLTPRETQLAAQLDTATGDFRRRVDIEDRTPDIDLRQRGRGETGSVTELVSQTEAATDTVAVEQQTPEVAFDSEPGSVNAGGELAETVETGVETSVESQFRQSVGETGQQRFFQREQAGVDPGSDTDTRLGVTPGSDIGVGSQPRTGVETGVGVDPRTAIDSRAESRTDLETGVETAVETTAETETGLETGIETQIETERETEREREIDLGLETEIETERDAQQPPEDDDEGDALFASNDDIFDSGILSGSEALQSSFGR